LPSEVYAALLAAVAVSIGASSILVRIVKPARAPVAALPEERPPPDRGAHAPGRSAERAPDQLPAFRDRIASRFARFGFPQFLHPNWAFADSANRGRSRGSGPPSDVVQGFVAQVC